MCQGKRKKKKGTKSVKKEKIDYVYSKHQAAEKKRFFKLGKKKGKWGGD